jgi:hypothetical protein
VRLVFNDEDFFLTSHVRGLIRGITVCCITFEGRATRRSGLQALKRNVFLRKWFSGGNTWRIVAFGCCCTGFRH